MLLNGEGGEQVQQLSEAYVPYILEIADEVDGSAFAVALVVLRRESGLLLALPSQFFTEEVIVPAMLAGPEEMLGPSIIKRLPASQIESFGGGPPPNVPEVEVDVLLMDFTSEVLPLLSPCDPSSPHWDMVHFFHDSINEMFPIQDSLVAAAWEWISTPTAGERVHFYSADEEVPECPIEDEEEQDEEARPTPTPKRRADPSSTLGGRKPNPKEAAKDQSKMKRPTVASLATSLEGLAQSIPALMAEMASLSERTQAVEESLSGGQRSSALRRPLGGSALGGSATASTPIPDFLKVMPPPKTSKPKAVSIAAPTAAAAETEALVEEREETTMGSSSDLAKAVLAQSTALTTLVGQLAGIGGEAIGDLSSNPLALTSRGAAGRARLQQELAQQKGVFFTSVYQQMSRRMSPATSSNATPQELAQRGVTATRYVERYGGFGRCRDLGQLMWQLSLIMDHLQNDNMDAAKDGAALMMVCLEQSALDGGQLDVGLLLALVEDPPSSLFTNRSVTPLSRGKAFAPLAEQRWITTALSYIKELDAISARRADVAGASSKSTAAGGDPPNPKPKVKRKPKAKWQRGDKGEVEDQ